MIRSWSPIRTTAPGVLPERIASLTRPDIAERCSSEKRGSAVRASASEKQDNRIRIDTMALRVSLNTDRQDLFISEVFMATAYRDLVYQRRGLLNQGLLTPSDSVFLRATFVAWGSGLSPSASYTFLGFQSIHPLVPTSSEALICSLISGPEKDRLSKA